MSTLTTHTTANRDSHSTGLCKFNTTSKAIEVSDGTDWLVYDYDFIALGALTNANSFEFGGSDEYMTTSAVTSSATSGTVSLWVKTVSGSTNNHLVSWSEAGQSQQFMNVRINPDGEPEVYYYVGSTLNINTGGTVVSDNAWHHIALVSSGSAYSLYVDGVAETLTTSNGSNDGAWVNTISSVDNTTIGASRRDVISGGSRALIDEVAIWDSALTSSQISQVYNGGTPPNLNGLSPNAWYRMGDDASDAWDSTNWTIVNAATGGDTGIDMVSANMEEADKKTDPAIVT